MDASNLIESTNMLDFSIRNKSRDRKDDNALCVALRGDDGYLTDAACSTPLPAMCGYYLGEFITSDKEKMLSFQFSDVQRTIIVPFLPKLLVCVAPNG